MIAGLGALEIQMIGNLARLRQDMQQATSVVSGAAENIKDVLSKLGLAVSGAALVAWTRSAINAAAEMNDLAQKVGLTVGELGALQFAFQQSGISTQSTQTALTQLSKSVVDNERVFKALGIAIKNNDGTYRATNAILGDVSDIFADLPDGVTKTKLATELFGKAGADLIPVLNQGQRGLDDMKRYAEELGAVITDEAAAAADDFGDALDVLRMKAQAMTANGVSGMLPVLTELAKQFAQTGKDARAGGTGVSVWEEIASTALETVGVLALNTVYVFRTFFGEIEAIAAQAKAVLSGNFDEAARIRNDWIAKSKAMREEVDRQSAAVLGARQRHQQMSDALKAGADAAGLSAGEARRLKGATDSSAEAAVVAALRTKEKEAADKAAADEAKRHAEQLRKLKEAGQDYVLELEDRLAVVQREINLGRTLTDEEKALLDLEARLKDGKMTLTDAEKARAQGLIVETAAATASRDLARELNKLRVDEIKATLDSSAEIAKQVEEVKKQNEAIGKTEAELQVLEQARLADALATAEQRLQVALLTGVSADELEGITMTVEELRKLKRAKEEGWALKTAQETRDAAKATADEWKKTVKSIEDGLVGALMRAFESGKGFMDAFKSVLVNSFKTMVLEPTIRAIVSPVAQVMGQVMQPITGSITNAVGSFLGMPGIGGGNGIISAMSLPGMGTLAGMGSAFSGGFGLTMSGLSGTGLALEGAGAMMAGGELGAGLAQAAGALGPYVLAALAVAALIKKFDKSGTPHMGSVVSTNMFGEQSSVWGDPSTIMNNYNKDIDTALRGLSGVSVGSLNTLSRAFGGQGGFSALARFASDNTDPSIAHFQLSRYGAMVGSIGGDDDWKKYTKDAQAAFGDYTKDVTRLTRDMLTQIRLPEWAREQLEGLADDATLEQFAQMTEVIAATQEGLRALIHGINPLGTIFTDVAGLSSDALKELTDFAGGIDAFAQKTSAYVSAYYTEPEQAALQARQIRQALRAAGLSGDDLRGLDTREEFRALVESRDVTTAAGREQLAALLTVAPAFAGLVEYLGKNRQTLMGLSDTAPAMEALNSISDPSMKTATAAETTAERLQSSNVLLESINGTLVDMADRQIAALNRVETQLRDINESTKRTADTAADYWNP